MRERESILGLSLGTTQMGVAIYSGYELADWRVRNFRKGALHEKEGYILSYIERLIDRYGFRHIAIKVPDKGYETPVMEHLRLALLSLARRKDISVAEYPLEELKLYLFGNTNATKRDLVETLTQKFPDLLVEYARALKGLASSYEKIYEAVAAIQLYRYENSNLG